MVYVRKVEPGEDVVAIKQGVRATVKDILRQDVDRPKLVIGIFMSPFDVHCNRAPLTATIDFHPAPSGEGRKRAHGRHAVAHVAQPGAAL